MEIYWPGVVIGVLIGVYWARVLKLVHKTRKTEGRAANFLPPEPLGRAIRIVWYPATVAWIVVPLLVGIGVARDAPGLRLLFVNFVIAWLGIAIAILAFVATLICWKKMGKSSRMGIDPEEKTSLIVTGPYAYVRHPIYALQCVLVVASFFAVPTVIMGGVALVIFTFLQWEARREERYLVSIHGAEYTDYLRRVGRFMPRTLGGFHHHTPDAEIS